MQHIDNVVALRPSVWSAGMTLMTGFCPVLKITQCVLYRLENFLFYLILQPLPRFAF